MEPSTALRIVSLVTTIVVGVLLPVVASTSSLAWTYSPIANSLAGKQRHVVLIQKKSQKLTKSVDNKAWAQVRKINSCAAYHHYLRTFRNGRHTNSALKALRNCRPSKHRYLGRTNVYYNYFPPYIDPIWPWVVIPEPPIVIIPPPDIIDPPVEPSPELPIEPDIPDDIATPLPETMPMPDPLPDFGGDDLGGGFDDFGGDDF